MFFFLDVTKIILAIPTAGAKIIYLDVNVMNVHQDSSNIRNVNVGCYRTLCYCVENLSRIVYKCDFNDK